MGWEGLEGIEAMMLPPWIVEVVGKRKVREGKREEKGEREGEAKVKEQKKEKAQEQEEEQE